MRIRFKSVRIFLFVFILYINMARGQKPSEVFEMINNAGVAEDFPGSNTVVIFDSTKVDVKESGLSYVWIHKLTKVLTPVGARDLRTVKFSYDSLSAYVDIQSVVIYKNDGRIIQVNSDDIVDYPAPARWIYWRAREKMAKIGRLEVGDAVEVKVFRKGFTYALLYDEEDEKYIPPMKGHFYDIVEFWSSIPVLEKCYKVTLPKDKPLQYEIYNGELQSSVIFSDNKTIYLWSKKNIKPFERETDMVAVSDVAPKLLLSTSPDWQAKSIWFYGVNEDYGSFDVTPEVKEKTDEIIKGSKSNMEKISRLTHWVAEEIRYSGLSMGPGEGYTLHKGGMTFTDRCGVCKDKAGMLVTMLRAAGFESFAAMTMAGSRIDRIPADQFNHSVTLLKKPDGSYMLLDPTWVPGVRELWSSAEQQQEYLMGVPEGAGLKSTPISPPEEHYYRVKGSSILKNNGTLEGKFSIKAEKQSDARIRRALLRNFKITWKSFFEEMMYHISPNTEILELKYQDPYDISRPMEINIKYRIPEYAQISKNEIRFTPVVATYPFWNRTINHHLFMNMELEEREYGFRTTCSRLAEFEETITFPKSYKIDVVPEYEDVDGSGAAFEAKYKVKSNKLKFKQRLTLKKRIYIPEDWESFRNSVRSVKKVASDCIVLIRKEGR
ncbi:MAG: DUF3857 and transglutaminase domain-containing protein [Candidatus Marinimicrobia bacterium]|nr:DUF3857 and transglutaminase domain-containing protein [Candidatus Neomarinimicrobiota bacterium]